MRHEVCFTQWPPAGQNELCYLSHITAVEDTPEAKFQTGWLNPGLFSLHYTLTYIFLIMLD